MKSVVMEIRKSNPRDKVSLMIRIYILFLLTAAIATQAQAQTFTIVNHSKTSLFFQIKAGDGNDCKGKYSSITASVDSSSTVKYKMPTDIQWNIGGKMPDGKTNRDIRYLSCNVFYTDPSGACETSASNYIGETKCGLKGQAVLNTTKCGGVDDHLAILWSSQNGNVKVTIN